MKNETVNKNNATVQRKLMNRGKNGNQNLGAEVSYMPMERGLASTEKGHRECNPLPSSCTQHTANRSNHD